MRAWIMAFVPAASKPSYDELAALVVAQAEQIAVLRDENAQLKARITELEARLNQNSRNSSKPPGSDSPFVKPAPKSLRAKGVRRPGRPDGQPGVTLEQVAVPDAVLVYEPEVCSGCGDGLAGRPVAGRERRQVIDLPQIVAQVTEHQLVARRCGCGQVTKALAPVGVTAPVQYGPRIAGLAVGLWHGQFLAKARVAQIMGCVFGAPMAPGTVASMATRVAGRLGEFTDAVRDLIARAPVAGFDETGFRVEGALRWVHCAQTGKYSLLTIHPKRGVEAMDAAGVLPAFTGVAVHDAWAPYDTYSGAEHALCAAHLLRELIAVTETGTDGDLGSKAMAAQAIDVLLRLKDLAEHAHAAGLTPDGAAVAWQRIALRSAAEIGRTATAGRENKLVAKHHALFTRIEKRIEDCLRFTADPAVPFDNNASEREIRMCKLRIKVSGSMRSMRGAEEFCRIRSYLQTARKHDIDWLDALTDAMRGIPWMPTTTAA
jgi:transposase